MARTATQVAAWAKRQKDIGSGGWRGLCLKFSRMAAGAPGGVYDANTGWSRAKYKHRGDRHPPRGAIVWWHSSSHGHVAVSAGDGDIYSTDIVTVGKVSRVPLGRPEQKWGQRYMGWSEDVNGVRIEGLGKSGPVVLAAAVGERRDVPNAWYHVDPKKVTTGLNWYSSKGVKRGVRRPNFNVHVVATRSYKGHTMAVTDAGNLYRMDYLVKGKA